MHAPTAQERAQPGWGHVELVIDEWLLLEYACCFLPCQQHAVVEAVSKALPVPDDFLRVLGVEPAAVARALPAIAFTPLEEIDAALRLALGRCDWAALGRKIVQTRLDALRGRI